MRPSLGSKSTQTLVARSSTAVPLKCCAFIRLSLSVQVICRTAKSHNYRIQISILTSALTQSQPPSAPTDHPNVTATTPVSEMKSTTPLATDSPTGCGWSTPNKSLVV